MESRFLVAPSDPCIRYKPQHTRIRALQIAAEPSDGMTRGLDACLCTHGLDVFAAHDL